MKITGENILEELDGLLNKKIRILSVQDEEDYGSGYIGVVKAIKKEYWEKGHYDVYRISIDLRGFEEHNHRHDNHAFQDGKSFMDMDFYNGIIEYRICTKYGKYELEFKEDKEEVFFEILEKPKVKRTPYRPKREKNSKRYLPKKKRNM